MTHREALEFLTRIGAEETGDGWWLAIGTTGVRIVHRPNNPPGARWVVKPDNGEVDECFDADPRQALLDLGSDLSDMASHCSSFGLAVTRLAR